MNIFKKVSLLVRSQLSFDRDDEPQRPPDAPTIEYPQVEIKRTAGNRPSASTSSNHTIPRSERANQPVKVAGIDAAMTVDLREKLLNNLNEAELQNLCLDMNIAWDDLPGGKGRKVMEMMVVVQRNNQLSLLIELCELSKPEVAWR